MGKKSEMKAEVKPTTSCPKNDEPTQHIQETTKRKKNKMVKTCEPEMNVKQCNKNVVIEESAIPNQPEATVETINSKNNKKKNGISPEDEPIDEAELDAFCGDLDEEANSTLQSWINLLEARLSEGNSHQNTDKKKKRKKMKDNSNDSIDTQQRTSDSV